MSNQDLAFQFKIDSIVATIDAPTQSFALGLYKPPTENDHYKLERSTGWLQWTMDNISYPTAPRPTQYTYSTSVFYAGDQSRYLFHPADCREQSISIIEMEEGERWGWRRLAFSEIGPRQWVLGHDGNQAGLRGRAGSYSPDLLPDCYYLANSGNHQCELSGKMSLLLALTAYSARPELMEQAISYRLNIREGKWERGSSSYWGSGRKIHTTYSVISDPLRIDRNSRPWPRCVHCGK